MGDEDLGAVQEVVITLVHRGGGGAAGVAAGAGFRQSEPAQHLAAGEERDVPPALFRRAELDDRGGAEVGVGADREGVARVHLGQLVEHQVIGDLVHARPAEGLVPRHAEEAQLAHLPDVVPREF